MRRIKDRDVRAMRAHLHNQFGEVMRLAILTPFNRTFTVLGGAAFRLAALRRFSPTYTHGDVVRFVAKARGHYRKLAGHVDPLLAEYLILQAVGGEVAGTYGKYRRATAQLDLLRVLVEDLQLDENGIEELLDQARQSADEWLRKS